MSRSSLTNASTLCYPSVIWEMAVFTNTTGNHKPVSRLNRSFPDPVFPCQYLFIWPFINSGTAQNVLNYIKKDLANTFESSLEMRPWVQIDMVEGRFVKSVTIHGNEPSKLTSIYITISTSGTFKRL